VKLAEVTEFLGLPPREVIDRFLTALVTHDAKAAVTALDEAFADGFDPEQLLHESIRMAREGALALLGEQDYDGSFAKEPQALARLPQILRVLVQAMQDLTYVPQPLVALHLAVLSVCTEPASPTIPSKSKQASVHTPQASVPAQQPPSNNHTKPRMKAKAHKAVAVRSQSTGSVDRVKKIWPELIAAVKSHNPVASTFLRAMQPIAIDGQVLRVAAQYTLHRNFFEKEENRKPLEKTLGQLLTQDVEVRVSLDENGTAAAHPPREKQAAELLATVKEVFGTT